MSAVTFWHYIRIIPRKNYLMKVKKISKPTLVILSLVTLNLVVLGFVSNGIKHSKVEAEQVSATTQSNAYFKSGVEVLNWSYTLLKYFKQ